MPSTARAKVRPITDWAGYWFLLLERHLAHGDLESAAAATRELERLGVEVRYRNRLLATSEAAGG
jgi:hypothetical protein